MKVALILVALASAANADPVTSKWDASLYGFIEADAIYDSTQGLSDFAGTASLPRPETYAGNHGQLTYGARNSRFGLRISAPTYDDVKPSGQLELDFLGNQAGKPFDATGLVTEAASYQTPTIRLRLAYLKLETPVFDVVLGQTWELFGWQSYFHPNSVEIQGLPGEVFSRTPQLRIAKTIKTGGVDLDLAVAALRSPQRASATPDGQGGIKLSFDQLKVWHTAGAATSALDAAAIGVSVVGRRFAVDELSATPHRQVTTNGYGISVDALLPIIPATAASHGNALTLSGSYARGAGIADLYAGFTAGVSQPALPVTGAGTSPTFTPNIDNGLAMYAADGTLHAVQVQSYIVGAQYYLPPSGRVFVSANYSRISSDNSVELGPSTRTWNVERWGDLNLFVDVTPAVRLGLEGAMFDMHFNDDVTTRNFRVQTSAFLVF